MSLVGHLGTCNYWDTFFWLENEMLIRIYRRGYLTQVYTVSPCMYQASVVFLSFAPLCYNDKRRSEL